MTGFQKFQTWSRKSFESAVPVGGLNCCLHNRHILTCPKKVSFSLASRDGDTGTNYFLGNGSHCFHSCELFVRSRDDSTTQDDVTHMLHCLNSESTCPRDGSAPKCGRASPDGNLCHVQHNKAQAASKGGEGSSNFQIQFVPEDFIFIFAAMSSAIYLCCCQQLGYKK